ncbi:FIMAH domain-containing protein [Neobacillus sp. NPDC058068]|uniref:FIMAH domain-containing protein n=1 Tax=Neobacillus sp. NPDC058068 TaxID=3346325 RepID=UPI0036D90963
MFNVLKLKKSTKITLAASSVLLALPLLTTSFTGKSNLNPMSIAKAEELTYFSKDIALNPGSDESELRFTWYSTVNPEKSIVQIAKKSDMTGNAFPVDKAITFTGAASPAAKVGTTAYYSNKVTITDLEPSTQYVYRVGDGKSENWSPVYNYATQRTDQFSIMFVGDPQIGASGSVPKDEAGWKDTLNKAMVKFPNLSYIMSAGDQVETATNEAHYDAFMSPDVLRSLPVASAVGNHDTSVNYKYHFNQPNESTKYGVTSASGDYYYTYGDALFMVLNTNNTDGAGHVQFMKETAAKVPNAKFKFVTFHHDIYGAGPHSTEALITNLRAALFPTFDELNVDVIFMGHDHSYVRTYVMKGDIPQRNQLIDSKGRVVNPTGSMYITANSASGSKYYELKPTPEVYSEVRSQLKVPTFSTVNVDKHSVSVDTYRTDTMEKVDTWSMVKTSLPMLQGLVEEYSSNGDLNTPLFNQLTNTLKQAEHHLNKGSKKQAVKFMQDFLEHLNNKAMQKNITQSAKDVLADNAQELILYWSAQ